MSVPTIKRLLPAALLVLTACSSGGGASNAAPAVPPVPSPSNPNGVGNYIRHVVIIVQENRTLENFFAGYPGADAPMYGYAAGKNGRRKIPLRAISFDGPDLRHDWYASMHDWDNGKMDGFDDFGTKNPHNGPNPAYTCVKHALIEPYWTMAHQYVLADHMFPTEFGGSFTGHLTLVAGTDDIKLPNEAEVNFPSAAPDDCDSKPGTKTSYLTPNRHVHYFKGPFPCFDQFNSSAEMLDNAGVSWKIYATKVLDAGFWEPFEALKYVRYGADWPTNVVAPQTKVLSDAGSGNLASVNWVTPSKADSDHPGYHGSAGPSWVASVVNAVGESSYWPTSAIIVVWDDWGGFYDNAAPPQLDYRGLGIRVPCLIISPYAKQGYVSHVQYEYGSILSFIEEVFNIPAGSIGPTSKGYTDGRATSLDDAFDFTQKPRSFTPITTQYPMSHFIREPPSNEPVDTE